MKKWKKIHLMLLCFVMLTAASCSRPAKQENGQESAGGSWEKEIDTVNLTDETVTTEDFTANTLTVFNVWATWCPPCVAELPYLQEINELFKERGVEVVGVLQDGVTELGVRDDSTIADAATLLEGANADYRVILPDETLSTWLISQMQYFPTTFFVDSNGEVVETVIGANDVESWTEKINEVLEKYED